MLRSCGEWLHDALLKDTSKWEITGVDAEEINIRANGKEVIALV